MSESCKQRYSKYPDLYLLPLYQIRKILDSVAQHSLMAARYSGALKMQDMKMQDMKLQDMQRQSRKLAQKRQTSECE